MTTGQPPASYPVSARTVPTRHRERAGYDAQAVHAVLDEALICHVGTVDEDGEPLVLPTIHARVGDLLYLHGSSGARMARRAAADPGGLPVCVTVTVVDDLVLARSQFHHSMNYRSVVVRGRARVVQDPAEKDRALRAVVEHVAAGRAGDSRPADERELAATTVLVVPIEQVCLKARSGDVADDPEDLTLGHWAGLLPVRVQVGPARDAADLTAGRPVPDYLLTYRRP